MDENIENLEKDIVGQTDTDTVSETDGVEKEAEKNDLPEKTEIIGVRFKKEGKTYYFAPNGFTLKNDDRVIVDTSRGQEYGYVAVPNTLAKTADLVMPLRGVVRLATEEDNKIHSENLKKEIEAYNACIVLIDEHNPKMKLIDVEYSFDRSKMIFYFSAEERVDFREIVKALATMFRTRIEMRQIGIRDEAKMLGGLGVCGRPFCCSAFLTDFVQVSVKMAKEQNISLNAAKISGACGKLMCCLRYEYDTYVAEKALTPKVGSRVMTPDGPGEVTDANPLAGIVKVRHDGKPEDAETVVYVREDVVKEEEYNGETLTKTEVPKRGKSKEEEDILGAFSTVKDSAEASVEPTKKEEVKQSNEKNTSSSQEKKPVQENSVKTVNDSNGSTEEHGEGKQGGKNGKHHKKKHKGHGGNHGQPQNNGASQSEGGQNRNEQSQNKGQGHGAQSQSSGQKHNRYEQGKQNSVTESQDAGHNQNAHNHGDNKNGHNPDGKSNGQNQNSGQGNRQNGQGGNHGGHHKKKHFKPYHKKFDNGGSQSGGQGGNGNA